MSKTKQQQYQQDTTSHHGNTVKNKGFTSILNETKKLTNSISLKNVNKHLDIHYAGVSVNNTNYKNNPIGA